MKANFKINKDDDEIKNEKMSTVERVNITDEEFEKKGMNVWTYRSKSRLSIK